MSALSMFAQLTIPFRRLLWPTPPRPTVDADGLLRLLTKGRRHLRWDRDELRYVVEPTADVTIPAHVVGILERRRWAEAVVQGESHIIVVTGAGQRAASEAMYRRSAEKLGSAYP